MDVFSLPKAREVFDDSTRAWKGTVASQFDSSLVTCKHIDKGSKGGARFVTHPCWWHYEGG